MHNEHKINKTKRLLTCDLFNCYAKEIVTSA